MAELYFLLSHIKLADGILLFLSLSLSPICFLAFFLCFLHNNQTPLLKFFPLLIPTFNSRHIQCVSTDEYFAVAWSRQAWHEPTYFWYAFPHLLVVCFGWPTVLTRRRDVNFFVPPLHSPFSLSLAATQKALYFFCPDSLFFQGSLEGCHIFQRLDMNKN